MKHHWGECLRNLILNEMLQYIKHCKCLHIPKREPDIESNVTFERRGLLICKDTYFKWFIFRPSIIREDVFWRNISVRIMKRSVKYHTSFYWRHDNVRFPRGLHFPGSSRILRMHLAGLSLTKSSSKLPWDQGGTFLAVLFSLFYFGELYPSTVRSVSPFFHPLISGANLQHSDKFKVGSNKNDV